MFLLWPVSLEKLKGMPGRLKHVFSFLESKPMGQDNLGVALHFYLDVIFHESMKTTYIPGYIHMYIRIRWKKSDSDSILLFDGQSHYFAV